MSAPPVFDRLARPVQKWIRAQGWAQLRQVQADAARAVLDTDADIIVSAATAGGKTEAAFLPLISQVVDAPCDAGGFDLLYIGPLKALITDQADRLCDICQEAELPVVPWHGDVSASVKARALKAPRGILLITPESLEALFVRRGQLIPTLFAGLRAVVIDELHTVLDSERGVQMRSLLTRLEITTGKPVRRIGLSATLGDMELARAYLRPDGAGKVRLIAADGDAPELRLQVRGYVSGAKDEDADSATDAVAQHLFTHLRGQDNLVFAGSRGRVEIYADRLRHLCEQASLPQEFHAHHASLSRDHRSFVEARLKDRNLPTTAVCTSTLELGIDIGDVTCVAQIGAPFSVAALRQRLGRSGRRAGQPAILRQYAVEARLEAGSNFTDQMRLALVRTVAMIELLLEGWCEPPRPGALHLSTLVHQILSMIAERGGARAERLYRVLCVEGPFRAVDAQLFGQVLRDMGEATLIEQSPDSTLLLGKAGERLVEHYSFYAVFKTPEEYRLIAGGKELGTLPVDSILTPGMFLIFAGRRWRVEEVIAAERTILVKPAEAGVPPLFGGDAGLIHDKVMARMFEVYEGEDLPRYLDETACDLLTEGRAAYRRYGFDQTNVVPEQDRAVILATRAGTVRTATLALALAASGCDVTEHDGFLIATPESDGPGVTDVLRKLAQGAEVDLFAHNPNLIFEKFHPYLGAERLQQDTLSARLAHAQLADTCAAILSKP